MQHQAVPGFDIYLSNLQ